MTRIIVLVLAVTLLGGCAIVPLGYGYRGGAYRHGYYQNDPLTATIEATEGTATTDTATAGMAGFATEADNEARSRVNNGAVPRGGRTVAGACGARHNRSAPDGLSVGGRG